MVTTPRQDREDRESLLQTAKAVAEGLKHSRGTRLRIRIPQRVTPTNTDGWRAIIGDLGKNQPRLEVWLDRFIGHPQRKFYAGFYSTTEQQIISITKRVPRTLRPARIVTVKDTAPSKVVVLVEPLSPSELRTPVLEKFGYDTLYGIYGPTRKTADKLDHQFCARAVAFLEDVACALPPAAAADEQRDIYPQFENRKRVVSHLQRERSRLLSTERKTRDKHKCKVCGFRFEDVYGKLGIEFAEAHHLVPLKELKGQVKTRIEDLATVCANCHRMLHRMQGMGDDLGKLRAIVRKRRDGSAGSANGWRRPVPSPPQSAGHVR